MLWLVIVLLIFIFQILTILLIEYRKPAKTLAWLFILFVFPIIGFVMYYFLATEYSRRQKVRRHEFNYDSLQHPAGNKPTSIVLPSNSKDHEHVPESKQDVLSTKNRLDELLDQISDGPRSTNNEIKVLTDADEAYPAMLEAMEGAKRHIHFEIYTFRGDAIGLTFLELLIRKAKQGVQVRCIFDGVGSYQLEQRFLDQLRHGGVEVYLFLRPLIAFFDKRMNYRNHRRILVIDGYKGYVGGLNIGAEYMGADPKLGFWRDTHLELVGTVVHTLQSIFLKEWMFVSGKDVTGGGLYPDVRTYGNKSAQIISSGPDTKQHKILQLYFGAITNAQQQIILITPYFIPDPSLRMALKTAAISGLDVKVVYPLKSDSPAVNYAASSYFEELMEAGVRIYGYQKGFMHAKILIIDDNFASVGSANVDLRSFYSNFELNALLFDKKTIRRLEADCAIDLRNSTELKLEIFRSRSRWHRTKEIAARLLSPLF
ncbi:cardiolipin synthase [Paenibacillus sp. WQ 127069]|uniref:Cardiolipin synthase n=1 Tax=Paenibacillus baimaensis TaxID=2982185 RepID=A0ABT2URT9_9BACL|nr:cardiolipin synthase [Paenibacillus sp. WQ 127069]MCU6797390.1 cardiolipin synthase [Paenibacillus sp. WQ 127069]